MELYSRNMVQNPSAEDGTVAGWAVSGDVTVVDGGVEGHKCFRLGPGSSMSQVIYPPSQPSDFRVECDFLAGRLPNDTDIQLYIEVELRYADGTIDRYIIPCRRDDQNGAQLG